jgi:TonB family protein
MRPFRVLIIVWLGLSVAPLPARADEPAGTAPIVTPPALETFVEAVVSPEAGVRSEPREVELILSIDASGRVQDAQAEGDRDGELERAAVEAARKFVFRPATRDGKPFAAHIRYRYQFEASAPAAPTTLPGELAGRVDDRSSHAPVAGADIELRGPSGSLQTASSGPDGSFVFSGLEPGAYTLAIHALAHQATSSEETVSEGARLVLAVSLTPIAQVAEAEFSAVARVEAQPHEVVRRTVPREDLIRTAGTRGDPLRTIELLPGVARPPSGQGMVLVRGSAPGDSQVFLGGMPIYSLYHFGGLTSVANGFLLSGIDLYPGNFSVRYGRKTGGVIETGFRDPKRDRLHGTLDVNLIDASLLVETPITKNLSIALAGRRSYMDAWFKPLAESAELSVANAPVYYDYQAILAYTPSASDRIRLIGYGSYDQLQLGFTADEHDPAVHGDFEDENAYHRGQIEWHRVWSPKLASDLTVASGPLLLRASLGNALGYEIEGYDVVIRNAWHAQLTSRLKLHVGLDAQIAKLEVAYSGPGAQQAEGDPSVAAPLTGREIRSISVDRTYLRPALYGELVAQVTKQLELTAGVRVDYFGEIEALTIDPRLNARLSLGSTTMRAGVGLFSQPPDYTETLAGFGNPKLDPARALHLGAGVEQSFGKRGTLALDGFYKQLSNLVVNGDGDEPLINRGKGRIYGLELLGKLQPIGRVSGFVAYTLSRSERNDKDGSGYRLFDYDQTHILTASGNLRLGRGWLLGSTFRLGSGNPSTPVVGSLYQANADVYLPVYGATNSDRDPLFHRLDVRVEKRWAIGRGSLTWYLDVQNAYNRQNAEGRTYSYDYARRKDAPGLPIIPSIGLRGEL